MGAQAVCGILALSQLPLTHDAMWNNMWASNKHGVLVAGSATEASAKKFGAIPKKLKLPPGLTPKGNLSGIRRFKPALKKKKTQLRSPNGAPSVRHSKKQVFGTEGLLDTNGPPTNSGTDDLWGPLRTQHLL